MRTMLIPSRDCGDCSACCVFLDIQDPALKKPAGVSCKHLCEGKCRIQDAKPKACAEFFCAWRYVDELGDEWRPDQSGVLAIMGFTESSQRKATARVQFVPLGPAGTSFLQEHQEQLESIAGQQPIDLLVCKEGKRPPKAPVAVVVSKANWGVGTSLTTAPQRQLLP